VVPLAIACQPDAGIVVALNGHADQRCDRIDRLLSQALFIASPWRASGTHAIPTAQIRAGWHKGIGFRSLLREGQLSEPPDTLSRETPVPFTQ
jgi:hypothetical protein